MTVEIHEDIVNAAPRVRLGVLRATVRVEASPPELRASLDREFRAMTGNPSIATNITAANELLRRLGKDCARYRPSAAALSRRAGAGHEMYSVNNVVDINNLISMRSGICCGAYDSEQLLASRRFRIGLRGESYDGIGKNSINLERLPVFSDEQGPYGSPVSDSRRTMITLATTRIELVFIDFAGDAALHTWIADAGALLRSHADATVQPIEIIGGPDDLL